MKRESSGHPQVSLQVTHEKGIFRSPSTKVANFTLLTSISPRVNVIARLELGLIYFKVTVQHFSHTEDGYFEGCIND